MKSKHLLLLLLTSISITSAFAQPLIKAQKTIGGSLTDNLSSIDITNDGGLIVGGNSNSNISGEKTEKYRGLQRYPDYWIIKLAKSGKIQWDKTIGGNDGDYLTSIKQTKDSGYILGGYSRSNISGEKSQNSRGDYDYWVVKLDKTGSIQWDKTFGGTKTDKLSSIAQTTDGGYILGGSSDSPVSGEKTENPRGLYDDYWLVKTDAQGNKQWDKTIGGTSYENMNALAQTTDGGYILGGRSTSNISGEKTENGRGGSDFWVVKLDNAGNIQWDKTMGGSIDDELYTLQQLDDGSYLFGGWSNSNISGDKTENSRDIGYGDFWIVKMSNNGNIQWDKTIGGADADALTSLTQTSDKGFILGGSSSSDISGEKTENSRGSSDYWAVKLDKTGNIQWDKTIGGNSIDYLYSIKEAGANNYLLGGYSLSDALGDKTEASRGGYDYWLVKLKYKPVAIASLQTNLNNPITKNNTIKIFSVYPNPAKDILHIQNTGKAIVTLTNQSGKILITKTFSGNGEINVVQLPAGLYYLKNNETGVAQKVMITK